MSFGAGEIGPCELLSLDDYSAIPSHARLIGLPDRWPQTRGRKGIMRIDTSGLALSVFGLRFHPNGAFTTLFFLED